MASGYLDGCCSRWQDEPGRGIRRAGVGSRLGLRKKASTMFNQEEELGAKCKYKRGWLLEPACTQGVGEQTN